MSSSQRIEDYPVLTDVSKWKISEANTGVLKRYINAKRLESLSLMTIQSYVSGMLPWLRHPELADIMTATADDIAVVYLRMRDDVANGHTAANTLTARSRSLRSLLIYCRPDEDINKLLKVKLKQMPNLHSSDDYLTESDIKKMVAVSSAAGCIRDVALIMILFGTGARISEIVDANIGDVKIMQTHAVLTVNGKTGQRRIPFVVGLPEIMTWLNNHPKRLPTGMPDPDAPLFVTKNTRGNGVNRLNLRTAEWLIESIAKQAGIPDTVKTNPHAFRHLLATKMAKELTAKEMNLFFGWAPHSNTAMTYIHTSEKDLESSVLTVYGVEDKTVEVPKEVWVTQCPSCGQVLPAGAPQCTRCRLILDPVLAIHNQAHVEHAQNGDYLKEYMEDRKNLETEEWRKIS